MRQCLEREGTATAEVLANAAGISTGLVSALLKQDIAAGRISFTEGYDGKKRVYRHVDNPPPPPKLLKAIEELRQRGYKITPPERAPNG